MSDPADNAAAEATAGPGSDDVVRADAPVLPPAGEPFILSAAIDLESAAFEALSAPADDPASGRRCPRCQADLDRLSLSARFCPRCGLGLGTPGPAGPFSSTPIATSVPPALPPFAAPAGPAVLPNPAASAAAWLRIRQGGPAGVSHRVDIHSAMLLGYANAMYRLGRRYEIGHGTGRNVEEAIRCYFKAAKLGNPAALARLAPQCAGGDAADEPTPPEPHSA
jgi:TPR repeat protein